METSPCILIVDDNREIRDLLARYLEKNGMRTRTAEDARAARRQIKDWSIDLMVLDIMMPGEDGLALCRQVRTDGKLPIIFLTAMDEETDRIVGLEMGADDYIAKPFNPRELLARIKAVLRRYNMLPPGGVDDTETATVLTFGKWKLDTAKRHLEDENGIVIPLSTAEFRLLSAFTAHPGVVLSRDRLLDITQGREAGPYDRAIDNQISRLRRKIEDNPKDPQFIKTVWGGGYTFAAAVSKS
ncbi:MAG: response regulator [Alphaproteobacteria bacterium]